MKKIASLTLPLLIVLVGAVEADETLGYRIAGDYLEGCACRLVCPCDFGEDAATMKGCQATYVWHIEKGRYGDVGLDGLTMVGMILKVKAVGADRVRRVRARIVAASNRSLEAEVKAGRFRLDLYYRLAVFPILVPPLRHRMADLPELVSHFLHRFELHEGRETGGFDADALRALQSYPWPGNVRELENEVHRLVLSVGQGRRIGQHHLARRIRDADPLALDEPLDRVLARVEIALIRQRLRQKPTKSAAARSLGITREALYAKMRRLGMGGGAG